MMKIKNYGSNQTVVQENGLQVLYSYETPVALISRINGEVRIYRTEQFHSVTTSKHINKFLRTEYRGEKPVENLPQSVLDDWRNSQFTPAGMEEY